MNHTLVHAGDLCFLLTTQLLFFESGHRTVAWLVPETRFRSSM